MREALPIEEAPVARAGPRSPDAFYRGEEAGAAIRTDMTTEDGRWRMEDGPPAAAVLQTINKTSVDVLR